MKDSLSARFLKQSKSILKGPKWSQNGTLEYFRSSMLKVNQLIWLEYKVNYLFLMNFNSNNNQSFSLILEIQKKGGKMSANHGVLKYLIVGKGVIPPPPFSRSPSPPPLFSKIRLLSRNPRCPHLSQVFWENKSTE